MSAQTKQTKAVKALDLALERWLAAYAELMTADQALTLAMADCRSANDVKALAVR